MFGEVCIIWGLTFLLNLQQFTLCLRPHGKLGFQVSLCIQITSYMIGRPSGIKLFVLKAKRCFLGWFEWSSWNLNITALLTFNEKMTQLKLHFVKLHFIFGLFRFRFWMDIVSVARWNELEILNPKYCSHKKFLAGPDFSWENCFNFICNFNEQDSPFSTVGSSHWVYLFLNWNLKYCSKRCCILCAFLIWQLQLHLLQPTPLLKKPLSFCSFLSKSTQFLRQTVS